MKVSLIVRDEHICSTKYDDVDEVGVETVGFYKESYKLIFPANEHGITITKSYPKSIYDINWIAEEA